MNDPSRKIILEFLQTRPRGKSAVPFVRLCLAIVQYHLVLRLKSGRRLPQDLTNPDRSIEGLASDVVGHFLCEKDEPPYPWIFDYLALRGYTHFAEENLPQVERLVLALIWGFTDRYVFKINREDNPELGKVIKAIEAALRQLVTNGEIVMIEVEQGVRTLIRSSQEIDLRSDLPMITSYDLLLLVSEAYACSRNKVELCRCLVKLICEQDRCQRQFYKHEFLEAAKSVIAAHALFGAPGLASMPGPLLQLLKETIEKERLNTLELISKPVIEEQSRKGRITKEEILLLLEAVDRYLQDVCNFAFDGLPVYFREVLPGVKQSAYRQDYKYAFETVMSNSREDLFDRIRKNSTIQRLRHYL